MAWILDVVLIIFIILSVLLGAWRGIFGSLAKLLSGVLRLVVSILLTKPLVALVSLTELDEQMFEGVHLKLSSVSDKFNVNLVGMDAEQLGVFSRDALADADIPKIFRGFFLKMFDVSPDVLATRESVTLAQMMSVTIVNLIMLICSFILLNVLLWILSKLLIRWSKKNVKKTTLFARTNKWLGAVFGFTKSLLIIFVAFVLISFLGKLGLVQSVITYIDSTFISKWLYRLSELLIDSSFDLKAMLKSWF